MNSFAMRDNWAHGGNVEDFFKKKKEATPAPKGYEDQYAHMPGGRPRNLPESDLERIKRTWGPDSSMAKAMQAKLDAAAKPTPETTARLTAFDTMAQNLRRRRTMSTLLTGGQGVMNNPSTSETSLLGD